MEVPANSSRKNVIPRGQSEIRGMLLGLFSYGGSFGVSSATAKHPQLSRLLVAAIRAIDCDFPFTSIQLNYNYASRPHVDRNNVGCSYIVGFGEYEGGELWVHDSEVGDDSVDCTLDPQDENVSAYYTAGSTFPGRLEDVKGRWIQFDGNKLHYTKEFRGNRYTLVYFTSDTYPKVPNDVRSSLNAAGFDFNWDQTEGLEEKLRQKLAALADQRKHIAEERAHEAKLELMRRGRCIARVWANGWGQQCSATCMESEDMCQVHVKGGRWKTHGRFDGGMPPAKEKEMRMTQQKWIKRGQHPPAEEPWTKLVDLP
jgi:hypothetical protein